MTLVQDTRKWTFAFSPLPLRITGPLLSLPPQIQSDITILMKNNNHLILNKKTCIKNVDCEGQSRLVRLFQIGIIWTKHNIEGSN